MESQTLSPRHEESTATIDDACRICQARGPHELYVAREMMFGLRDSFEYFQCRECECLQIRRFPENISDYYPKQYYAHTASPEQEFSKSIRAYLLKARVHYAVFGRGLVGRAAFHRKPEHGAASLRSLKPARTTAILDVGCGTGMRLYTLKELGFQNLLGADPYIDHDIDYKNGLHIQKGSVADVSGKWDIIMFHHSFEHIDCPLETLQQVRRLLQPNGHCILRIPTASSYAWRHYRTDWVQLDAPRHYFLHSRLSIQHLAKAAGLRVTAVKCDATDFQFLGSELYYRNIPLQPSANHPKLFDNSVIAGLKDETEKLNAAGEGDSAAFYLAHR